MTGGGNVRIFSTMIAERLPALMSFSKEEKWQVVVELQEELLADDPTMQEPLKSEIVRYLNEQIEYYMAHPETAVTPEQLSEKMRAQKALRAK